MNQNEAFEEVVVEDSTILEIMNKSSIVDPDQVRQVRRLWSNLDTGERRNVLLDYFTHQNDKEIFVFTPQFQNLEEDVEKMEFSARYVRNVAKTLLNPFSMKLFEFSRGKVISTLEAMGADPTAFYDLNLAPNWAISIRVPTDAYYLLWLLIIRNSKLEPIQTEESNTLQEVSSINHIVEFVKKMEPEEFVKHQSLTDTKDLESKYLQALVAFYGRSPIRPEPSYRQVLSD